MAWPYWVWVLCNVVPSVSILILTTAVLGVLQWRYKTAFYGLTAKLCSMKRCVINVNHTILRKNSEISTSRRRNKSLSSSIRSLVSGNRKVHHAFTLKTNGAASKTQPIVSDRVRKFSAERSTDTVLNMSSTEDTSHRHDHCYRSDLQPINTATRNYVFKKPVKNKVARSTALNVNESNVVQNRMSESSSIRSQAHQVAEDHPAHPAYERAVLDMYGKYLPLRKKTNQCLIVMITSIIITAVICSFFEGRVLASRSVYPSSPCPAYGDMDCFHGFNSTYFMCEVGQKITFPLLGTSATCFRLIIVDQNPSTIMQQIGICAGLLTAFGALTEVLIRLLLYVFQERRGVANGMRRVLEKTVGINNITDPSCFCCVKCPCRVPPIHRYGFRYPRKAVAMLGFYILLSAVAVIAWIPLIRYQVSVTSYTYIILFSFALICIFAMAWVVWESDEICRTLPGGNMRFIDIFANPRFKNMQNFFNGTPWEDMKMGSTAEKNEEGTEDNEEGTEDNEEGTEDKNGASEVFDKFTELTEKGEGAWRWLRSKFVSKNDRKKKLPEHVIKELQRITKFSEKNIEEWHTGFLQDCPGGLLEWAKAIEIAEDHFGKRGRAVYFCEYLFRAFDKNRNNQINFAEFLVAIAPNTQGELEDRLRLGFKMYDTSGSKTIEQQELIAWIKATYDIIDMPHDLRQDENDPTECAMEIMKHLDKNKDGRISLKEFTEGCKKNKKLMVILDPLAFTKSD